MGEFDPRVSFTQSPVARLATGTPDGVPHLVPVVFAVDPTIAETVYTAVDAKPKTTQRLRRLANIENNPQASLLVDHYCRGLDAVVVGAGRRCRHDSSRRRADAARDTELLRAKYPQYQSVSLDGPVIAVAVRRWSSWHA